MNSGYYAASTGLSSQMQAMDLVANNLANVNTGGYRGQQPTFRSLLTGAPAAWSNPLNRAINDFNVLASSRLDLSEGSLDRTGSPFDLAIEGAGFFVVQTAAGTRYTRSGNFQVSAIGQLANSQGNVVLGEQGPITIPKGNLSVSSDGTVSVDGAVVGKLRVADFAADTPVVAEGGSLYSAPDGAARPAAGSSVRQGMLESSNVSPVAAALQLIAVQRHAEMMGRALSVFYSEFDRIATSDLPRV